MTATLRLIGSTVGALAPGERAGRQGCRRVAARFATTHSAVRWIEASVPVGDPDPQIASALFDGMATGTD